MDKKSRLEGELRLTEVGRDLLVNIARSKHTNPSSIKVDDKKIDIITIPEGATNGDMIKAMFPNQTISCAIPITDRGGAKFYRTTLNGVTDFTEDWWNALYKGEYNLSEKPTGSESEDKE